MSKDKSKKRSIVFRLLDGVEKVGNALPHPAILFVIFCVLIVIASAICQAVGVTATFQQIDRSTKEISEVTINAVSMANADGLRYIFTTAVKNFTSFAPLGTVLVAMLGVGIAEGSGLINTSLKKLVMSTPKSLITCVLVFAGVMSNIASDAGYVVLVPLGAIVFLSFGRHPLAGIAAVFAGVSGGYSANLLLGTIDPLLSGLSTEAAKLLDQGYVVEATSNYYFMIASTFIITAIGWFVTDKIVEPRLGEYDRSKGDLKDTAETDLTSFTPSEKKGLKGALVGLLLFLVLMVFLVVLKDSPLRNQETGDIMKNSPFVASIVFIIALFFSFVGIGYGVAAKTIKKSGDIVSFMSRAMAGMGSYLVLAFFAAQFINYFSHTNLGTIMAVKGADFLQSIGFTGLPLLIAFILVAGFINLFIGSASAKWAILAPIFIPMFMSTGISPELTQLAYRIGDSTTNIISPLMSYFAVIVAFAQKYDKESGVGTIISTMVPYSILFMIGWTILLVVFYVLKLPIGADSPMIYSLM